jgi:hypothetical protein
MPGDRMNTWTVDKATIRADIRQRNALRKSALLPLLDEQTEFDHACTVIKDQRWHAFRESKQADRQRIRDEMLAGRRPPSGSIGGWGFNMKVNKRFEALLRAQYADEIAIMMEIAPDYLAITRQSVETRSPPGEIAETG